MIVISAEQFQAIERAYFRRRDEQLVDEVARWFPRRAAAVDRAALAALVAASCERARSAGCTEHGDRLGWSVLALLFGAGWDADPQLVWAAPALSTPPPAEPGALRMAAVLAAGLAWRTRVMGPDDEFLLAALERFVSASPEQLLATASRSQPDLLAQLAGLYPEKRGALSDALLAELLNRAIAEARELGLLDRWGVVYVVLLMLLFGAGVLRDPLYAPVAALLSDAARPAADRLGLAHAAARALVERQFFHGAASLRARPAGALLQVPPGGLAAAAPGEGASGGIVAGRNP
jgi:hypothetical protein